MTKYYRVKKDTFMWLADAILHERSSGDGYVPVEDVWNKVELSTEYISAHIIENPKNSDFFERVYPDSIKGNIYRTADQVRKAYKKAFK